MDLLDLTEILALGNKMGATSIHVTPNGVRYSTAKPRKKAKAGDIKMKHGKKYVRQQQISQGCYVVRGRRPVWEWVPEE